ncbi:MAG TPA: endonuclease [Candidatus Cloacimonadota bacterium]|nr:endonuclease [Candidatus Cloacimonadota bacterium]HPS38423.1 endonuclease [Candidatus Cloacimonadota bacterium]
MTKIKYALMILMLLPVVLVYAGYYDNVLNLTGTALKSGLHTLISTNTNSSYDNSKTFMFQHADNLGGSVRCIYTGQIYPISSSYNGSSNPNTEHTYAQSWFSSTESSIKKADVHHLFPTNSTVNSSRGNLPFWTVANHSSADVYYTTTPWQSYRGSDGNGHTVFEPCDQQKGNVARALLYFNVRYNDSLIQGGVNMLPILLQWHTADPVDAAEVTRNTAVFGWQSNRNPFVDHPEFVSSIWGPTAIDDDLMTPAPDFGITAVYPNPFSGSATLSLDSKESQPISIMIFNLRGQLVRHEVFTAREGLQEYVWDGDDDKGLDSSRGTYIIRLKSDKAEASARVQKN